MRRLDRIGPFGGFLCQEIELGYHRWVRERAAQS